MRGEIRRELLANAGDDEREPHREDQFVPRDFDAVKVGDHVLVTDGMTNDEGAVTRRDDDSFTIGGERERTWHRDAPDETNVGGGYAQTDFGPTTVRGEKSDA